MNTILVVGVLLMVVFLASFLPSYVKAKHLENELRAARYENSLAQLRDLACLTYLEAAQKDYGLAAGASTRFFNRTREVANGTPDPNGKKALEDLLNFRDKITTELAQGDPGVLSDLQGLLVKTRQATAIPPSTTQPE
jgi:hypothetical protein